jgi:hypothetical protein
MPVSAEEIRAFLGISLYMGITRKPSYRDYWSNEPDLHDSYVSQLMPVKRFSFLLSHIHLNNSVQPCRDSPNFDFSVSNDRVCVYRWKDKKGVNLISSVHNPSDISSVDRMEKDGNQHKVPCPQVLKDYNRHMNFVDNFDRLKGDYQMNRKIKKWWLRFLFHFMDCS